MQPDFPFPNEPFALLAETTLDGARITREAEQLQRDRADNESKQTTIDTKIGRARCPQRAASYHCPACGMLASQCDCWDPINHV